MNDPERIKTAGDSAGISYAVLRTLDQIRSISSQWDLLLAQSSCNRAFSCSKWFIASTQIDGSLTPFVIVARRGVEIAGILPLVISGDRETITFAGEFSDYNDMIVRGADDDVLAGLLIYCSRLAKGYRRIELNRVRGDSNCAKAARLLNAEVEVVWSYSTKSSSSYIRLPSNYQDYLMTRSRNFRKGLSRARRAAENHDLYICELEADRFSPSQLPEAFLSLNLERFGAECYYELASPRAFVQKALPDLFAERRLRAFALMKEEKLLALDLCMVGANSLCAWNGGFSSEAGRWSPGTLLMDAEIKQTYSSKLEELDLLRGNEPYKDRWVNGTREIGCFEFSANRALVQ